MSLRRSFRLALLACTATLAACASTPPPVAEISAARTAVSQAQPAAARYAPEQLRTARDKLALAEQAMVREDYDEARMLAEQAQIDARLAHAMADSERLRSAAAEVNRSIEALKQQAEGRRP